MAALKLNQELLNYMELFFLRAESFSVEEKLYMLPNEREIIPTQRIFVLNWSPTGETIFGRFGV